jgi:hypothetical protein
LSGYDSEEVQCVEVVGLSLQNFPIDALGVREFPLLMERHCLLELGLQCRRNWSLDLRAWPPVLGIHRISSRLWTKFYRHGARENGHGSFSTSREREICVVGPFVASLARLGGPIRRLGQANSL